MASEKYEQGLKVLEEISPGAAARTKASLDDIAPDMVKYLMEFVFGEISSRPGLDMRAREITAVASLATLGTASNQLKVHIKGALNCGVTREEIVEVLMQILVYAGFPAALTGLRLAKEVFNEIDEAS